MLQSCSVAELEERRKRIICFKLYTSMLCMEYDENLIFLIFGIRNLSNIFNILQLPLLMKRLKALAAEYKQWQKRTPQSKAFYLIFLKK